ncbi:hypothetical protein SO694_00002351 [Aureococcus anophagefferens]|uniref:U3 small nucleolar RNA-associated protein 6 N-terminal domain-containing protein n=1 Tax=Aureococcus anophagefferens TaxID=44056 RepID=A0ABR1GD73_AURAN
MSSESIVQDPLGRSALIDLEERGILSRAEARSVLARRERFEVELGGSKPTRASFLRYVVYELKLDRIRASRTRRLAGGKRGPGDFFGVRHRLPADGDDDGDDDSGEDEDEDESESESSSDGDDRRTRRELRRALVLAARARARALVPRAGGRGGPRDAARAFGRCHDGASLRAAAAFRFASGGALDAKHARPRSARPGRGGSRRRSAGVRGRGQGRRGRARAPRPARPSARAREEARDGVVPSAAASWSRKGRWSASGSAPSAVSASGCRRPCESQISAAPWKARSPARASPW